MKRVLAWFRALAAVIDRWSKVSERNFQLSAIRQLGGGLVDPVAQPWSGETVRRPVRSSDGHGRARCQRSESQRSAASAKRGIRVAATPRFRPGWRSTCPRSCARRPTLEMVRAESLGHATSLHDACTSPRSTLYATTATGGRFEYPLLERLKVPPLGLYTVISTRSTDGLQRTTEGPFRTGSRCDISTVTLEDDHEHCRTGLLQYLRSIDGVPWAYGAVLRSPDDSG